MNPSAGHGQFPHQFQNPVPHMTIFGYVTSGRICFLNKLVQRPALAEIRIGRFAKLTGLGGTSITDNFAMKMVHWGLPVK
jgi:hypothetical protein